MGSLTRGLSDDIMSLNAEPILGVADDELLSVTLNRIAKHVDSPLRLFASASPNTLLNIASNVVEVGDGAAKTTPPLDGSIGSFPATTIDMQTGVVTGGTVKLASEEAFALPPGSLNYFRRMCLSLSGSSVYVAFSPEAATVGALEDPGLTFANLLGLPAGFLTIQVTDILGKYKTANSLTSIIENKVGSTPVIMRFGAGGGGGGAGGDESFKIRTVVADGTTTVKGGSIALSDGKVMATYSGSGTAESNFNQNIVFDLDTLQPAAVNNTTYYLYVDLDSLTPTTLSDTGRVLYGVTAAKLVLLTTSPEAIDRVRYAAIGSVRRATGTWSTTGVTYPPKRAISDAPGDNSFKPMSVSGTTLVINRGSLMLADSRELYSAADISVSLAGYASDGNYYIYVDLLTLPAPTVVNGRTVTLVTASNFVLMTSVPSTINRSRYMPVGFIVKATTWQTPIPINLRSYSFGIDSSNYQEYTLPSQAIGAVGSSGQIAAGHDLVSGSFPSAALASTSFFNLAGLLDANTSLAHDLLNMGTAVFTGTGILGAASSCVALNGSSQYLRSTDIHFDPGDTDFTFGGWVKPSSLLNSMPLCSQSIGGSLSFYLTISNFGAELLLGASVDGSSEQSVSFPMTFTAGAWYHLAAKYVASTNTFHVYVNAIKIGTHTLTGNLRAAGASRNFQLGGDTTGGKYFPGNLDEFFFCNGTAFSDEAINKIFAYKLSHNKYIVPSGQDWLIHAAYNGTTKEISNSIIVTKDYNDLYIDLSGYDPTTVITAAMETKGAFGTAVPANARMLEGTAAEIDTLINGVGINFFFPSMITAVELWVESDTANLFERHPNVSGYFLSESVSPYRLMFNTDTLTSILGGTKKVKLLASCGNQALAVNPYIFTPVSRVASFNAYPFDENLVDTTSGIMTGTLPLSPRVGDEVRFIDVKNNFGTNNLTIARNGKLINGGTSNFTCSLPNVVYTAIFTGDAYGWVISSGGGGGGGSLKVTPVTGAYNIGATDVLVRATGSVTYAVTLPLATVANTGQEYIIKSAMNAGVALTVNTTSSQTIDGVTSISLARFESLRLASNGSGWDITSDKTAAVYG